MISLPWRPLCAVCARCCAIAWNDCSFLSNWRLYFNTWVWLQDRSCFPGGADTPAGGWVDRHGAGAVVQRPGHRGRTDNYKAKREGKKRCLCISHSEVAFLTQSKNGSGVGWEGVSEGVCVTCVDRNLPSWRSCQEVLAPDRGTMAVHLLLQHRQEPESKKTNHNHTFTIFQKSVSSIHMRLLWERASLWCGWLHASRSISVCNLRGFLCVCFLLTWESVWGWVCASQAAACPSPAWPAPAAASSSQWTPSAATSGRISGLSRTGADCRRTEAHCSSRAIYGGDNNSG